MSMASGQGGLEIPDDVIHIALQPEVIRMLARKTAAAIPQAFEPQRFVEDGVGSSRSAGLVFKPSPRPVWSSSAKMMEGKSSHNVSDSLAVSSTFLALDQSMAKSFASDFTNRSPASQTGFESSRQSAVNQRFSPRSVVTPCGDMTWTSCHDMQWDGSNYLTGGFPMDASADVCGARRIPPPEPVPRLPKAIHMIDPHHPNPFERNNAWAAVYSEKLYQTQLAKFHENEAWMIDNDYFHPQLSEKSIKIAERRAAPPLYQRVDEIVSKKNELLNAKRIQKADDDLIGHTFTPKLCPKSARRTGWHENNLFRWEEKRAQKLNGKLEKQREAEAKRCSFSPVIGDSSKDLVRGYVIRTPVYQRLVNDSKRRTDDQRQEQQLLKLMKPQDFEDMWADERTPEAKMSGSSPKKSAVNSRNTSVSEKLGSPVPVKAHSTARASTALFHDVSALQENSLLSNRSTSIGRQSRMSRVSRFSKAKRTLSQGRQSRQSKTTITRSGINTVRLQEGFAGIADSVLSA